MASRDMAPPTRGLASSNDKAVVAGSPATTGGMHDFRGDHNLRPGLDLEHNSRLSHNPLPPLPLAGGRGHMVRGERDRGFFSSDDAALTKQILATHAPDIEDLNVKPVLSIVEDILRLAKPSSADHASSVGQVQSQLDTLDNKRGIQSSHKEGKVLYNHDHELEIVRLLAFPISRITFEIICKCSAGGEAHSVTMDLLRSLSNYTWDAKVVIIFAAFAINYGEFWLVEQLHSKNMLAKNIATLKDLPYVMEHAGKVEKKFEAVLELLNRVMSLVHCLIEFKELPSVYISHDSPEVVAATAHVPTAVYWIIRSILACASTLLNLIGSGHEYFIEHF